MEIKKYPSFKMHRKINEALRICAQWQLPLHCYSRGTIIRTDNILRHVDVESNDKSSAKILRDMYTYS